MEEQQRQKLVPQSFSKLCAIKGISLGFDRK